MKRWHVIVLLIGVVLMSGCGKQVNTEQVFTSPMIHDSPVTASAVTKQRNTPIPKPSGGKGAISGRFVDQDSGKPVVGRTVYLGELSPTQVEGAESHIVTVLPSVSPKAMIDKAGYFAFVDIEPSTYAMVLWTPRDSWVVVDPETRLDILVTVKTNAITDLGEVVIRLPN